MTCRDELLTQRTAPVVCQADESHELLRAILEEVKGRTGHDFSGYKPNTVTRRVERRMAVHDVQDFAGYLSLLSDSVREAQALCQDILIGVTSFFRDSEAFAVLQREVIPRLFAGRSAEEPVRIWHPCCATGEEAYSMAILVREHLDAHGLDTRVQIFATDLDEHAIVHARAGLYSSEAVSELGEARLAAWFVATDHGWQVSKALREMVVFAHHSLIKDPPFSRLDLLVCRNFLIYLEPELQKRLIALFYQVLNQGGFLFLGSAETVAAYPDLFEPLDKKWKLYRSLLSVRRSAFPFPFGSLRPGPVALRSRRSADPALDPGLLAGQLMAQRYLPPCVVVNERYEVLHVSAGSDRFLAVPVGGPTTDLLRMAREELRPSLRAAVHRVLAEKQPAAFRGVALQGGSAGEGEGSVNVLAEPLPCEGPGRLVLVILEPGPPPPGARELADGEAALPEGTDKDNLIRHLEAQLRIANEQLQATSEQLETSQEGFLSANEELISINEEFQSANEELQATNEELATSKEELQALNEELATVNAELHAKIEALNRAGNDMANLLTNSETATLFLDLGFRIKRYTPAMAAICGLTHFDIGCSFHHLPGVAECYELLEAAGGEEELLPIEREVTLGDVDSHRHFLMRVRPYRTAEGTIDGAVVTLVDITKRKKAEKKLRQSNQRLNLLASTAGELLASESPQAVVGSICQRVMKYLDCDAFFNFLVDESGDRLRLNAWSGIGPEEAQRIEWLDYGTAAAGCAALEASPVVIGEVQQSSDPRAGLIKGYGLQAYAVHPLVAQGRLLGTLSFGTRNRTGFSAQDLTLMKTVADQMSIALEHQRMAEALRRANDELEGRVRERTEQLATTVETLVGEITNRQQAEDSLRRLNSLYQVLNEIDQAIVRASDRLSLFKDFCRIATEQGGFLLAWVGLVDGARRLHVTAASGATGYLENLRLSIDDTEEGGGPTGIAIRQGSYYICNDFQNDPCTSPWHERGKAFGIHSSASIALSEGGKVIGTLTLYAGVPDFFDKQQAALLRQMGADLSFALENLRREERRRDAELALQEEVLERLLAVEELREKERLLIQQSRQAALGEMINNIAHQWRQPLNTLGLMVQELTMAYELGDFDRDHLERSVEGVMQIIGHMSRTIDDFRNFFRPEKEKVDFRVRQVIENVTSIVEASLKTNRIRMDIESSGDPLVHGYPNEFSQVLLNILLNARDVFAERQVETPRIELKLTQEGELVVVAISDNGGGIPDQIMDKIFDPYFTTKGPDRGTGIGLYMTKAIIEKNMNGKVTARNNNRGAEFRIEVTNAQAIQ